MNVHRRPVPRLTELDKPLAPCRERQRLRLMIAVGILDALAICASFLIVGQIYLGDTEIARQEAALITPLFLLFGLHGGLYRSDLLLQPRRTAFKCLYVIAVSATVLIILSFYAKTTASFSRVILTFGCSLSFALLMACRGTISAWLRRTVGPTLRNTLVIHAGGPDLEMEHAYHINACDHGITANTSDPANLDRIGRYMDRVIVSCPPEDRDQWAPLLRAAGVEGEFVSVALRRLGALDLRNESGFAGIVISVRPLGFEARMMKRTMDLAISTVALVLLAPLMAVTALLIKLEDGGPVLFKQRRVGTSNRFFLICKFRSMRKELADADGRRSTSRDDDRATRVGRFIRRTSIDELPQLFNVWRGDMSLVGPRPHALGSLAGTKLFWEIDGRYWSRHTLKPGITGLAQIRGLRGSTEDEQSLTNRLQADLEYIANWSLWLDLKIMLTTLRVLVHSNAY